MSPPSYELAQRPAGIAFRVSFILLTYTGSVTPDIRVAADWETEA